MQWVSFLRKKNMYTNKYLKTQSIEFSLFTCLTWVFQVAATPSIVGCCVQDLVAVAADKQLIIFNADTSGSVSFSTFVLSIAYMLFCDVGLAQWLKHVRQTY